MRYQATIFLPCHIYKMLSEPALKALKQYNETALAKYKGTRAANLHDFTPPDDEEPRITPAEESLLMTFPLVNQTWTTQILQLK